MCLQSTQTEPKIAEEDITIYKVVTLDRRGWITSCFTGFIWQFRKVFVTPLEINSVSIEDAESCDLLARMGLNLLHHSKGLERFTNISRGFHAATHKTRLKDIMNKGWGDKLAKGYIPKGSQYFEDNTGLIVANSMVLTEFV